MDKNINESKKEIQEKNKQIITLVVVILVVILVVLIITNFTDGIGKTTSNDADVADIVKKGETKIIFVKDSGKGKCDKCDMVQAELDKQKINYVTYDVAKHEESEYKKMLQSIEINPDDFGYPAVIYIKDGKLYSNAINISKAKAVQIFIESYELTSVK